MKAEVMDACGAEVAEKDKLREAIKIRLLYAIPHLVDDADADRAADSVIALFKKDLPAVSERWNPREDEEWFSILYDGEIIRNTWLT
jgi:hypothetical protein